MKTNKDQTKKQLKEIQALWRVWDPIGAMDDPNCPRDEYDSYAAATLRLLKEGAGDETITAYLTRILQKNMGLGSSALAILDPQNFVWKLREWYSGKRTD